jgi:hypothetical protein
MNDANLRVLDDPEMPRRKFGLKDAAMIVFLMWAITFALILLAGF